MAGKKGIRQKTHRGLDEGLDDKGDYTKTQDAKILEYNRFEPAGGKRARE